MMLRDVVVGVARIASIFVPSARDVEIQPFQRVVRIARIFLQAGFAFKICTSLNRCASHKD